MVQNQFEFVQCIDVFLEHSENKMTLTLFDVLTSLHEESRNDIWQKINKKVELIN